MNEQLASVHNRNNVPIVVQSDVNNSFEIFFLHYKFLCINALIRLGKKPSILLTHRINVFILFLNIKGDIIY